MKHLNLRQMVMLAVIIPLCSVVVSCMEEEKFDTPASATLRFSADTLYLDTVLTHNSSATKRFTIYNNSSEGVSITSIAFEGNKPNGFLANVDGTFIEGNLATPIDCRGKDSLFAFVQYDAQDIDQDEALFSEAKLVFTLANGKKKSIVLQAHTLDAKVLDTKVIAENTTLSSTRPLVIFDSLVVNEGVTLTIAPGTMLCFHTDAFLKVNGTLVAKGTQEKPVTFRGDRFDMMFKYQAYDDIYNQWGGITFTSASYDNELDYCDIHAGRWGIYCDSSDVKRRKLTLENSVVHNVKEDLLRLIHCQTFVGNTQITNSGGACLNVKGGDNQFVHCTIVSLCPFTAARGHALDFYNTLNGEPCPLERLYFYNSIITGFANDEVFAYLTDDETVAKNYGFFNCLLNTPEITDNPNVINNIWETKDSEVRGRDNFVCHDTKTLHYDFHPVETSHARWLADPEITKKYYPKDRLGADRLNGTNPPDAGCYQYIAPAE